jgi:hypothetical protein
MTKQAGKPSSARRISVVGASGSGKTFLARALAERLKVPHVELDALKFGPDGSERSEPDFMAAVTAAADRSAWVIDGHYRDVRATIWARADVIVWLNYSLRIISWRLVGRFRRKRVGAPPPVASGAAPIMQAKPAGWRRRLARVGKTLKERREYRMLLSGPEYRSAEIVELTSPRAAERWLAEHT